MSFEHNSMHLRITKACKGFDPKFLKGSHTAYITITDGGTPRQRAVNFFNGSTKHESLPKEGVLSQIAQALIDSKRAVKH